MNPGCQEQHDELILALSEKQSYAPALREHLEACAECRAFADRTELSLRALGSLSRLSAPADLDGRVVAALHAGFREDRTKRHLSTLSRLSAPQQLEVNLHNADGIADDLVARVEHELAHPEEVIGERLGRIAHRYEAPAELEQLVARDLASGAQRSGRRFMRLVPGLVLAAAASLVMLFNLKGVEPVKPSLDSLSFSVREVNSISELNPMAQLLVGGVTGGASDAREF